MLTVCGTASGDDVLLVGGLTQDYFIPSADEGDGESAASNNEPHLHPPGAVSLPSSS